MNKFLYNNSSNNKIDIYPQSGTLFTAAIFVLYIILGIIGNLSTTIALLQSTKLRKNPTTWFVLNLAFSDLFLCCFNIPILVITYIPRQWILGEVFCRIFGLLIYANLAGSIFGMTLIAINRFIAIVFFSRYKSIFKLNRALCMIIFTWAFVFMLLIPPLFELWGKFGYDHLQLICAILPINGKSPKKILFLFEVLFPLCIALFCYIGIFYKVRKSSQNLTSNKTSNSDESRLNKTILIILTAFFLSSVPWMIIIIADSKVKYPNLQLVGDLLLFGSGAVSPLIYAFSNSQYNEAYYNLFRSCFCIKKEYSNIVQSITKSSENSNLELLPKP